ncbi:hypothetical protein FAES_1804 [Fibrella aestuarina BUZ 2]|uniref:Uncharacterized protein n=1 Tax=Fibrella aestuarina BUZ 2 TaxID=1166018 RepID=I0K6R1_9BACT|nr:hypothetical protein [Fibrella aestuarina]CCG99814.1 hypothetical protein FAES_1804 [Fibrella aestuarina BUZ 2]
MKYLIPIDQRAIVEGGFDLDLAEAAIIEACRSFADSASCLSKTDEGKVWYWLSHKHICQQLPILGLKPDTMYRRMKALCDKGFFVAHATNKQANASWYAFGEQAVTLAQRIAANKAESADKLPSENNPMGTSTTIGDFSEPSDKSPMPIGSKSEPSENNPMVAPQPIGKPSEPSDENPMPIGKLSDGPSDENPMYKTINDNRINYNSYPTSLTPTPDFVDADAPTGQSEESDGEGFSYPAKKTSDEEPTSTPDQNNPAPGAATKAIVVNSAQPDGDKPARARKPAAEHTIGHKIHLMLEERTPGIPWGPKEGAAAKQIGERILNTLKKNEQPHDDDDVLQFLTTVIELTYQLAPFYHFTSITALNSKYSDIYQQLVDRKRRGNFSATTANPSTRPVRQTDAEFAADIDRFAEMRYGRTSA